jgi:hypothetical protein
MCLQHREKATQANRADLTGTMAQQNKTQVRVN